MDNQTKYFLLLADLRRSSRLPARHGASVMERLLPELERQNRRWAKDLVYPLEVNYGDEFAGLFSDRRSLYRVISDIREALRPIATFRVVTAYDRIGYAGGTLAEMGGPLFETAANALGALKRTGQFSDWQLGGTETDQALTAMTNAADAMMADMTEYQYTVYWLLKAGFKGVEIADRLGKDPKSISNAKKAGRSNTILALERAIDALLMKSEDPAWSLTELNG